MDVMYRFLLCFAFHTKLRFHRGSVTLILNYWFAVLREHPCSGATVLFKMSKVDITISLKLKGILENRLCQKCMCFTMAKKSADSFILVIFE